MGSVIVLPTGEASTTRQGLRQFEGIPAESVGSRALCAHLIAIPPGGRAKAHRHAGHETAIYLLEGRPPAAAALGAGLEGVEESLR